jgi:hypothetical protein
MRRPSCRPISLSLIRPHHHTTTIHIHIHIHSRSSMDLRRPLSMTRTISSSAHRNSPHRTTPMHHNLEVPESFFFLFFVFFVSHVFSFFLSNPYFPFSCCHWESDGQ